MNVYQHLALAILAFVAFEALLQVTGIAQKMNELLAQAGMFGWFALMGGVAIGTSLVTRSAHNLENIKLQYVSLFVIAGLEALIFAPMLYYVFNGTNSGSSTVWLAAAITAAGFAGLSIIAFVTRKDLSFLKPIVMWGFIAAIGLIIAGAIFGFELGIIFSVAMITLAGGGILYQTQDVVRRYPQQAYVGAAVVLFGFLMTMFWYVLRLLIQLRD